MNTAQRPYQFVGIAPYVDQAAGMLGLTDEHMKGKARGVEQLSRIQSALGQASTAAADDRQAIFDLALAYRESLAVSLLAAELAIGEVALAMGLDSPDYPGTLGVRGGECLASVAGEKTED